MAWIPNTIHIQMQGGLIESVWTEDGFGVRVDLVVWDDYGEECDCEGDGILHGHQTYEFQPKEER